MKHGSCVTASMTERRGASVAIGETVLVRLLTLYTVIEWHVGGLVVLKIRGCRIEQIRTTERLTRTAIYSN